MDVEVGLFYYTTVHHYTKFMRPSRLNKMQFIEFHPVVGVTISIVIVIIVIIIIITVLLATVGISKLTHQPSATSKQNLGQW